MTRAEPYNREAALEAAQMLFWKKGYHATSMKDVQDALNMKPGSIYAAFKSKEVLFGLALDRYFEINRENFIQNVIQASSPLEALVANLQAIATMKVADARCSACMLVKTVLGATSGDKDIIKKATKYLAMMEGEMARAFERAKEMGELPEGADAKMLARQYQSDITALKIEAHRGISNKELKQSASQRAERYLDMRMAQ